MNASIDLVFSNQSRHQSPLINVALIEGDIGTDRLAMPSTEIIEYNDPCSRFAQQLDCNAADVAGASGYQYRHAHPPDFALISRKPVLKRAVAKASRYR